MITLYAIPVSLYSAKTRIALRHKRLNWQEVLPPGGYGSAEYKRIVASGNLPALDDEGLLIADSEAIAEYLEERYPDPPLLPAPLNHRTRMRERSRFHDTRLEPALRELFPHISPERRDTELNTRQSGVMSVRLDQLSRLLEEAGPLEFGLGDCGYPVTFAWMEELTPLLDLHIDWPDRVCSYRERISKIPAVAEEMATYRPRLQGWLATNG